MRPLHRFGANLLYLLWLLPSTAATGFLLFPPVMLLSRAWTDLHRRWAGSVLGCRIPERGRVTWRDVAWLVVHFVVGLPLSVIALVLITLPPVTVASIGFWWVFPASEPLRLLTGTPVTGWSTALPAGGLQLALSIPLLLLAVRPLARGHAWLTRELLGASAVDQLEERVAVLTRTRTGAVDAHGAELRRIERDLHDGTQAKLVSIAMRLGIAKDAMADDPALVTRLIEDARDGAESAMTELRVMIRNMYPPILADRGLSGAMDALAAESTIPVTITMGDLGALPNAVDAAAYYVVSEALSNAARHSGANQVTVDITRVGDELRLVVADDGVGGADETSGTGLAGIRRRISALDGNVTVDSPCGTGTGITVELPCGS